MKDYFIDLSRSPSFNREDPPEKVCDLAMIRKQTAELRGVCVALLMDGRVTESEANGLKQWLDGHSEVMKNVLAGSVAQRVQRVFDDGRVDPEELEELRVVLSAFVGEEGKPIELRYDDPPPAIEFPGRLFCFTGIFASGSRAWCCAETSKLGGVPHPRVTADLHYLVVGGIASPAWANMNYGTKIEYAMELRAGRDCTLSIISEGHWLSHVRESAWPPSIGRNNLVRCSQPATSAMRWPSGHRP